jgi:hypothetical protein
MLQSSALWKGRVGQLDLGKDVSELGVRCPVQARTEADPATPNPANSAMLGASGSPGWYRTLTGPPARSTRRPMAARSLTMIG